MASPEDHHVRSSRNEDAAGTIISFIVAIAVFLLAFSVVTIYVSTHLEGSAETKGESIDLSTRADATLRAITSTPGLPRDWHASAATQDPARMGLLRAGSESTLDVRKIHALNHEKNTQAWYETTGKELFGLPTHEFHIRAYPVFEVNENGNVAGLSDYRVAYVGPHTGFYPAYVQSAIAATDTALLEGTGVDYVNALSDDGSRTTSGIFTSGDAFPTDHRFLSRILALRLAGFSYAGDVVVTGIANDTYWKVVSLEDFESGATPYIPDAKRPDRVLTVANRVWSAGSETWELNHRAATDLTWTDRAIVGPFDWTAHSGGSASFDLTHHLKGANLADYAKVEYLCFSDCGALPQDVWTTVAGGSWTDAHPAGAFDWAADTLDLTDLLGKKFYLALAFDYGLDGDPARRGWFVKDFRVTYAPASGPARVVHRNDLDYATTEYDAILVGSSTAQTALNDAATGYTFKHAVKNWVRRGGDLAALGSTTLDNKWLSPTFTQGGTPGAAGPLLAALSDPTHPVLNTPYRLQFRAYRPYASASYDTSTVFTKVLLAEKTSGGGDVPLLAVSNPNPDWNGTIVLTSYATAPTGMIPDVDDQPHAFLVNLLAYMRYNTLYLDWGGTIPTGVAVGSSERTLLVNADAFGWGTLQQHAALYVWRG